MPAAPRLPDLPSRHRRRISLLLGGALVATSAAATAIAVTACGSAVESSLNPVGGDGSAGDSGTPSGDGSVGAFPDAGTAIQADALVLVHAASFPAFRICFEGTLGAMPMPSSDLLPDSNVVGVDVGAAVRLPPPTVSLGRAFVFPEPALRSLYPAFGGGGPSCKDLLASSGLKSYAVDVGTVDTDVTHGVHALVLGGCLPSASDPAASTDRCGGDWTGTGGNLKLTTLSLQAYASQGSGSLSFQLVQLSPSLQRRALGRALGLAFGPLDGGAPSPFVEGAAPLGQPVPDPPAVLQYSVGDIGTYATTGVFVTLGGALDDGGVAASDGGDAGAREVLLAESLADIQKASAPRALPPDWFGIASSFVVLSVGDPDPRLGDGGKDDDARHALHLLAIPLATVDASAPDAGP